MATDRQLHITKVVRGAAWPTTETMSMEACICGAGATPSPGGDMRGAAGPKDDIMSMEARIRGEHEAAGLANKDTMNLSQARWPPWTWAIHRGTAGQMCLWPRAPPRHAWL